MTDAGACPKCSAPLSAGATFCAKCGFRIEATAADRRDIGARIGLKHQKQAHQQRMRSGRTTILVVAILTLIAAVAVYFIGTSALDKAMQEVDSVRHDEDIDPAAIAEADAENQKAERLVMLIAGLNILLGVIYLGLWVWAKARPLPATISALILFATVWVASAALDPAELIRGIIVKIVILVFLIKAVDSARKFQRMQEHGV
jgi:uncharacterized Zn finger protein (UPF0148 family)